MAETTRIVCIVEYDGTQYHGFQLQANSSTVQGEIEEALQKLTGEEARVQSASRTDGGVHAKGQVVSFRTSASLPVENFVSGMNHYLPADIAVKVAYRVRQTVNIRRDAVSREYEYSILNSQTRSPLREGLSYRVSANLDADAMGDAARSLVGEHDFSPFAGAEDIGVKNPVRRVFRTGMRWNGEILIFSIEGSSFLIHQVRRTVGTLILVGQGKMTPDQFCSIIEARKTELVGPTVPACGLCLMRVSYPYNFEDEI
ncbi:tRNA pseudouridine(38-40) synthase TruA [Chloroflexota bacterium]